MAAKKTTTKKAAAKKIAKALGGKVVPAKKETATAGRPVGMKGPDMKGPDFKPGGVVRKTKTKDRDRPRMDMSGSASVLEKQAEVDRVDARARHLSDGLKSAKEHMQRIDKAIAHGNATDSDDMKRGCLTEVADLASTIRDGARRAIRNAAAESRNVQS